MIGWCKALCDYLRCEGWRQAGRMSMPYWQSPNDRRRVYYSRQSHDGRRVYWLHHRRAVTHQWRVAGFDRADELIARLKDMPGRA